MSVEEVVIEHVLGMLEYVDVNVAEFLHEAAEETFKVHKSDGSDADKLDAIIDILYYIANAATKQAWHTFGGDGPIKYIYDSVLEFTEGSGYAIPKESTYMTEDQIKFICKMIINELAEYLCALYDNDHDKVMTRINVTCVSFIKVATDTVQGHLLAISNDLFEYAEERWGDKVIAAFDLVHGANMAKRFPDGKFHKREDGKIIKPDGWQEPDIKKLFNDYNEIVD